MKINVTAFFFDFHLFILQVFTYDFIAYTYFVHISSSSGVAYLMTSQIRSCIEAEEEKHLRV